MSTPPGHDRGIRRTIATVCLSGMLEDKLDAAAAAGFDGVEIFENDLLASSETPAEVRKRCADLGLSIDLYQPFRDFDTVLPDRLTANLRRAEHKFAVMEDLGTDTMLVCSSVAGDALDDPTRIADQFHELAERASRRWMRIAYEALAWGRHVNRVATRAPHPAVRLLRRSSIVRSGCPRPHPGQRHGVRGPVRARPRARGQRPHRTGPDSAAADAAAPRRMGPRGAGTPARRLRDR